MANNTLEHDHAVNRLLFLLRNSRPDPQGLEAHKHAADYLAAFVKSLAATDKMILKRIQQRIKTIEEIQNKNK